MQLANRAPLHRAHRNRRLPVGVAVGALVLAGIVAAVAPAQAATKVIPGNLVDTSETRATGHNVFGADGRVRVYTEGATTTDKAAGYFDVERTLSSVAVVEPTMAWTANLAPNLLRPGLQLKVDLDGDGSIDGTLVGEPVYADGSPLYGNDWWLSNGSKDFAKAAAPSHTSGFGSDNHGTLAQWHTAFAAAKVIQAGWSLGSGVKGDGYISSFAIAGNTYTFAPPQAITTKQLTPADVDLSETRSAGHNTFLTTPGGGVEIQTDDTSSNAKAAGYFDAGALPLSAAGEPSMSYDNFAGSLRPSVQLVVDFDNDGAPDGILVGEPTYPNGSVLYGNDWWLSNGSSPFVKADAPQHTSGFGSDNHGQLSEWRAAFPDAKILAGGWSLGSGVQGHGVINSITIGATRYTFTGVVPNVAPTASPVTGSGPFQGGPVTVTLAGHDNDGDALTYTAGPSSDGTVTVSGDQATFTPAYGFYGSATFPYTVKDAGHPAVASTVTITIGAPPVDALLTVNATVSAGSNASKRTIVLSGHAFAPLPAIGGFKVYENGAQRSGGSVSNRNYKLSLGPGNAVGTHIYTVVYAGHSSTIVVHAN
jgi:hypothetical protein